MAVSGNFLVIEPKETRFGEGEKGVFFSLISFILSFFTFFYDKLRFGKVHYYNFLSLRESLYLFSCVNVIGLKFCFVFSKFTFCFLSYFFIW